MKKIMLLVLVLMFFSLACLSTGNVPDASKEKISEVSEAVSVSTITPTITPAHYPAGTLPLKRAGGKCAVVIAERAQNLRDAASVNSRIILHLKHGDVVKVIDQLNADWWRVSFNDREGFARSAYLKIEECVK